MWVIIRKKNGVEARHFRFRGIRLWWCVLINKIRKNEIGVVEEWWLIELWIRSQSRLSLVKIVDVCIDYNNQKSIIANFRNLGNNYYDYFPLGEYDTEERALEVLDEIEAILMYEQLEKITGNTFIKVNDGIAIYEMPKE